MRTLLEPVRGTRDILPPDSEYYKVIFDKFSEIAELYGYRLAIVPTIEHFEIYEAKSGPGISRSMYVFQDKAGRTVCLRPEFTTSIIRAYLKHLLARPKPVKLYYFGQVFRYDEPQFGRYREFYQVGVEYVGDPRIYADIELFQLIRDFYKSIGLTEYSFRINDISIIRGLLRKWNIPEEVQDEILHFIDKGEMQKAISTVSQYAGSNASVLEELLKIEVRTPEDLRSDVSRLGITSETSLVGLERLTKLFEILLSLGLNVYVDLKLVRGLAYYTGTIFEISVPSLNLSIGGGGRYDTLSQILGGVSVPATGFSLGVERTILALESGKLINSVRRVRPTMMLISLVESVGFVDEVSSKIRGRSIVVDVRFTQKQKLSDMIGQASKLGYDYVAIIGDTELKNRKVTVKNMKTGKQISIDVDRLESELSS